MRKIFVSLLVLGACFGPSTCADSVAIVPRADQPGSFQFELLLDGKGVAPGNEAWVGFGPEKGLNDERWLTGRLRIDPSALSTRSASPGSPGLTFLRLGAGASEPPSLRFILVRRGSQWWLGAELWNRQLTRYEGVGKAPLTPDGRDAALVEFEWYSRADLGTRALNVRRVEADGSLTLLFSREEASDEEFGIGLVQLGIDAPGNASGRLWIDDFSIHRGGSSPAGPMP